MANTKRQQRQPQGAPGKPASTTNRPSPSGASQRLVTGKPPAVAGNAGAAKPSGSGSSVAAEKAIAPSSSLAQVGQRASASGRVAGSRGSQIHGSQQNRRRYYQPPWWWRNFGVLSTISLILIAIIAFIAFAQYQNTQQLQGIGDPVSHTILSDVTGVSSATAATVGKGTANAPFGATPASVAPLTANGKPVVVYVGADYCPYCAATRWSLVMALSRFGAFSGLRQMKSSSSDVYPNTATFTFTNTTYTSKYITLNATETQDRYSQPIATPDATANNAFTTYDNAPYTTSAGSIPFISYGNQYVTIGALFVPTILQGKTWQQIASQLNNPTSDISQAIVGGANQQTAAICTLTNNQPGNVCNASYIQQIEATLPARK